MEYLIKKARAYAEEKKEMEDNLEFIETGLLEMAYLFRWSYGLVSRIFKFIVVKPILLFLLLSN